MSSYDNLSPRQKKWVCEVAKAVYLECRGKTGRTASHAEAVGRHCMNMPAVMAGMVESLADSVRDGTITIESLDAP